MQFCLPNLYYYYSTSMDDIQSCKGSTGGIGGNDAAHQNWFLWRIGRTFPVFSRQNSKLTIHHNRIPRDQSIAFCDFSDHPLRQIIR